MIEINNISKLEITDVPGADDTVLSSKCQKVQMFRDFL